MKKVTLYHRKVNGEIKIWTCELVGTEIRSEWGQRGGEISRTIERARPKMGKSLEQTAQEIFDRKIKIRRLKGYVDSIEEVVADVAVDHTQFDFDKALPREFAPAKPFKSYDPDEMAAWAASDLLIIQRKRDGMRHYLKSDSRGRVRIYSSGKEDMTEHLLPLVRELTIPPKTIIDCELVVTSPKGDDEFLIVSSIARSKAERARSQIQLAEGMGGKVQLFAFDLLWDSGRPTFRKRYEHRYRRLAEIVTLSSRSDRLVLMPEIRKDLSKAIDLVKKYRWEGLVVWRRDQATAVQVNGSPKRINCWKVKPIKEEDVVAYGYELGKGKNETVVGKFLVGYWDPSRKNYATSNARMVRPMGKCGTGLDDATRAAALKWKYPCVIQIEYDQKSDKGFRFPVFIRKRDDKSPEECTE